MKINYRRLAGVLAFALVALISGIYFGNEDSAFVYATRTKIEERIDDALILSSASALSSVAVTLLPGDVATPVADKMVDLTDFFIVALLFLYTEKFLMSILGFSIFKVIIPTACLILSVLLYRRNDYLKRLTLQITLFTFVVFVSIPISTQISEQVYSKCAGNIETIVNAATTVTVTENGEGETQGILDIVSEKITGMTANFTNKVGALLHDFIDILAAVTVSSCVIPILVLVFLMWLLNKLFGLKVSLSDLQGTKKPKYAVRKNSTLKKVVQVQQIRKEKANRKMEKKNQEEPNEEHR